MASILIPHETKHGTRARQHGRCDAKMGSPEETDEWPFAGRLFDHCRLLCHYKNLTNKVWKEVT